MHNMKRKIAFLLAGVMVTGSLTGYPIIPTKEAKAAVQEENVNQIPNGTFDEVSDSWCGWSQEGGEATFAQKDGAFVIDVANIGDVEYSNQGGCVSGFTLLQGGKYQLSFDVTSTVARQMGYRLQMNGGDYRGYADGTFEVGPETVTITKTFTMSSETDEIPALCFNFGNYGEELDAHTITLDNVELKLIDGSGIKTPSSSSDIPENVNIIPNGTFDEVSDCWGSYTTDGGKAVIEQKDGALVCDIAKVGDVSWGVQASCGSGFTLYQNGKYRLSFDISSTIGRELAYGIQLNGGDYHAYVSDNILVDETTQTVTIEFTMTDETDKAPALFFNMGNYGEDLSEHTVTIDNVDLRLIDGSKIDTGVKKQPEGVNLIPGGTFDELAGNWGTYQESGGKISIDAVDGKLVCDIPTVGEVSWGAQTSCGSGFELYQNGKYRLSFEISSSIAREIAFGIQLNGGDYHAYVQKNIMIDEDTQKIEVEFTMTDETDKAPCLFFNMGNYGEDLAPHTVTIDNVDLQLVDGSKIVYESEEDKENAININQIGYQPDARKIAVVRGDKVGTTFAVVNAEDDTVVYEGTLSEAIENETAKETDYLADFSEFTTPGSYYIKVEGLENSYPFDIKEGIYNDVFKDTFRFFYLQRCGKGLDSELAGDFAHGDCHQALARIYGTDEFIDVSGGWHDAGDYGRYVVATSKAVADLLMSYSANPEAYTDNLNIPESGNGISDLLDEIRAQIEWMMKMQDKESGGVHHKVTPANFPGSIPADQEVAELIVTPITTTATADFAAIMGMAYEAYKDVDPEFAASCVEAGEAAYAYLADKKNTPVTNPEGIVTGEYGDSDDSDERYWAAASLYKATGKAIYHDAFKAYVAKKVKTGYGWQTVGAYGNDIYLTCENQDEATAQAIKDAVIGEADYFLDRCKKDAYETSIGNDFYWGSNSSVMNNAAILMEAYRITGNEEYLTYAKEHVNYILGKNAVGTSYVTAYGDVTPQNPHHRPSFVAGLAIPGAMVGGSNKQLEDNYAKAYLAGKAPAKCYLDHAESYSTNEVDIYWNSTLVRALAEMDLVDAKDEVSNTSIKADVKTDISVNGINQTYTVSATDTDNIDLSKLKLRYYFNKEDAADMNVVCDYAAVNYTNAPWYEFISSNVVNGTINKTRSGYYLELTLDSDAVFVGNQGSLTIMTRINNEDWTDLKDVTNGTLVAYYDGKILK